MSRGRARRKPAAWLCSLSQGFAPSAEIGAVAKRDYPALLNVPRHRPQRIGAVAAMFLLT